jgi:hypothetical protein
MDQLQRRTMLSTCRQVAGYNLHLQINVHLINPKHFSDFQPINFLLVLSIYLFICCQRTYVYVIAHTNTHKTKKQVAADALMKRLKRPLSMSTRTETKHNSAWSAHTIHSEKKEELGRFTESAS